MCEVKIRLLQIVMAKVQKIPFPIPFSYSPFHFIAISENFTRGFNIKSRYLTLISRALKRTISTNLLLNFYKFWCCELLDS
jgi:hypothetical protein